MSSILTILLFAACSGEPECPCDCPEATVESTVEAKESPTPPAKPEAEKPKAPEKK